MAKRIGRNTLVMLGSQITGLVIGLVYIMLIARCLGVAGFGVLTFALAFTSIFAVISDLGLNSLAAREIARDRLLAEKYLANIVFMKFFMVASMVAVVCVASALLRLSGDTFQVVLLVSIAVGLSAFNALFNSIFQAFEMLKYQSIGLVMNSALLLGGALIVTRVGVNVVGLSVVYVFAAVVVLGYSYLACRKLQIRLIIDFDWYFWRTTMREALPFGLSAVFVMVYYWIGTVTLLLLWGDEVVGWYNAAYRLVLMLLFINTAFILSIFPVISRFYRTSKEALSSVYAKSFKYMFMVSLPIAIVVTVLAPRIVSIFYGLEYTSSVIVLRILVWALVLMFLNSTSGNMLSATDRQRTVTRITFVAAVSNVILNVLLISLWGMVGAAIVTVITESIVFVLLIASTTLTEFSLRISVLMDIIRILGCGAVLLVIVTVFCSISLPLLLILCGMGYFGLLFFTRVIDHDDIRLLRQVLGENQSRGVLCKGLK